MVIFKIGERIVEDRPKNILRVNYGFILGNYGAESLGRIDLEYPLKKEEEAVFAAMFFAESYGRDAAMKHAEHRKVFLPGGKYFVQWQCLEGEDGSLYMEDVFTMYDGDGHQYLIEDLRII